MPERERAGRNDRQTERGGSRELCALSRPPAGGLAWGCHARTTHMHTHTTRQPDTHTLTHIHLAHAEHTTHNTHRAHTHGGGRPRSAMLDRQTDSPGSLRRKQQMGLTQQAAAAQIPYRYRGPPYPTVPYPGPGQGRGVPARLRMGEMAGPGLFGRLQLVTFWLDISAGEEGRQGGRGTKKRRKTPVKPVCLSPSPPPCRRRPRAEMTCLTRHTWLLHRWGGGWTGGGSGRPVLFWGGKTSSAKREGRREMEEEGGGGQPA